MGSQGEIVATDPKPINIAVIGGGFGGLALMIGLQAHPHINATIYEAAAEFAEIGVGVIFGPNAVRAMNLISPRILDGFKKHMTGNADPEKKNTWCSFRYGMDSRNGNGKKYGDLIWQLEGTKGAFDGFMEKEGIETRSGIHRARLLDELVNLIHPGSAKFGKRLVEAEELEVDGGVRLKFADGETLVVDAVVGCDGIKSVMREYVTGNDPDATPKFTGEYAYRALVPKNVAIQTLGDEMALNGQLYVGYNTYIITYPVEHHDFLNIAAVRLDDDTKWDDNNWIIPSTTEDMLKDFEGWGKPLIELLSRFEMKDRWGMYNIAHTQKYHKGRMCLLGDSAHASTPNLGAGAAMAFEDAYILGNLLGKIKDSTAVKNAFQCYDTARRARTQNVVNGSRAAGRANCLLGTGIGDDFEKLQIDINRRYRWVWDFDLKESLLEAETALKKLQV